jgi:hypothetical protein
MTMHADSMIDRHDAAGTIAMTARNRLLGASIGRIAVIALVCLVQAILILGFVAMSLGLGAEGHVAVGPDRPPAPMRIPDRSRDMPLLTELRPRIAPEPAG